MKVLLDVSILILVALATPFSCRKALPEPASTEPEQGTNWQLYTSPDKSFSVELPCAPQQKNVSATSSPIYEYSCGGEGTSALSFFSVLVFNMRDAEGARMLDEAALERSIKGSLKPHQRLVKMTPLKIEGGIGREIVISNTRDDMDNLRGRVIIFGGRYYEVAFITSDGKAMESAAAERFFETFKPLK